MTVKIDVTVSEIHIDVQGHLNRVRSDKFWTFAATEWKRLYDPYVPYRTGTLANTVTITPGQIEHTVPYAAYIYNGNFRFRKDQHPKASRRWDKAAEPTQKPKLIHSMQAYVDSGRLKFGG